MTDHTKEPWYVKELRNGDCFISAEKSPAMPYGPEIMGDDYTGYGDEEAKLEDARRIVACVNACAGIPTEALPNLLEQRNQLLEALEAAAKWVGDNETIELIDAAIASAKGAKP